MSEDATGVPQKGFDGDTGRGSLIENVWIEHEVSGMRIGNDPPYQTVPTYGLTVQNVRIRDTYADGINLSNGTSSTLVQNSHVRNVGDDSAVVWAKNVTVTGAGTFGPALRRVPAREAGYRAPLAVGRKPRGVRALSSRPPSRL